MHTERMRSTSGAAVRASHWGRALLCPLIVLCAHVRPAGNHYNLHHLVLAVALACRDQLDESDFADSCMLLVY